MLIYSMRNRRSGRRYVCKTARTLRRRVWEHAHAPVDSRTPIDRAVTRCGVAAFEDEGIMGYRRKNPPSFHTSVEQLDMEDSVVGTYMSMSAAERTTGTSRAKIRECLSDKKDSIDGFRWRRQPKKV